MRLNAPLGDIVKYMRRHITIAPAHRGDTFTVMFEGGDPEKVQLVTNEIAQKFIDENLRYREDVLLKPQNIPWRS